MIRQGEKNSALYVPATYVYVHTKMRYCFWASRRRSSCISIGFQLQQETEKEGAMKKILFKPIIIRTPPPPPQQLLFSPTPTGWDKNGFKRIFSKHAI